MTAGADWASFRCPVQVVGLDHDAKVFGVWGEDAFVALQYALDFVGELLEAGAGRLGLENRNRGYGDPDRRRSSWIWRYDSRPAEQDEAGADEEDETSQAE